MATIKDSVHDHIEIEGVAEALLDTPTVQRLRHIKQLGTVQLVYPSANHTRFEHSLGVYHLADRALAELGIEGRQAERVRAAALLHDVGHGPFSHNIEDLTARHTGKYHDDVDELLAEGEVGEVLRAHDLDPAHIAGLVAGEGQFGQLVSGELDVDRMDYLVRDAHHTGVPYGTVDTGRLVNELRLLGDGTRGAPTDPANAELVLAEGNVPTAESLLVARSLMNAVVYRHHVSRVAGAMLERACERYLDRTDTDVEAFRRMADHDLLVALSEAVPELGRRIERRDLYKRAVWVGLGDVPAGTVDAGHEEERAAEREIAAAAGVDERAVVVDIPSRPGLKESGSTVVVDGVPQRLADASELVDGLRSAERRRWTLGVYCPEPHVDAVSEAARDVLGLRTAGVIA